MQNTVSVAVSVLKIVLLVILCSCPVFADTSKQNITLIDLLHRKCQIEIKNAADSVRKADCINNETLMKSHDMYDKSFTDMKDAFSNFVNKVEAIILILSVAVGILPFFSFKLAKSLKKELDELKKEFKTKIVEVETKTVEAQTKIEKVEERIVEVERKMVEAEGKTVELERKIEEVEEKTEVESVECKFD